MYEHPQPDLKALRRRVACAQYRVNSQAVADAIVRRRWTIAVAARPARSSAIVSRNWDRPRALAA